MASREDYLKILAAKQAQNQAATSDSDALRGLVDSYVYGSGGSARDWQGPLTAEADMGRRVLEGMYGNGMANTGPAVAMGRSLQDNLVAQNFDQSLKPGLFELFQQWLSSQVGR